MKKIIVVFICMLTVWSAQAQQSKAQLLSVIRNDYTIAKKKVAQNRKKVPDKHMQLILNNKREMAMPPFKEVVDIYFEAQPDKENPDFGDVEVPYFMTCRYTCGDIDYYREWLFDKDNPENVVFAFESQTQNDGPNLESRYYWNNNTLIEFKANHEDADPEGNHMLRYLSEYMNVFNTIANRNWE